MFKLLDDLKDYNPTRLDKIKSRQETLMQMQKSCIRTGVISLRHLKKEFSVKLWISKRKFRYI